MREHARQFKALTYDIADSLFEDILSIVGFQTVVRAVCRVRSCGLVVLAPVCASYSWMSRYSTGRSMINPLGNIWQRSVADANLMVSRTIMLLHLIVGRGSVYVLEQPQGSIMPMHPRFQEFLRDHVVFQVFCESCTGHLGKCVLSANKVA